MKRTNSMIYRPTEDSRELTLYTINDGDLYRGLTIPIIDNLKRKVKRGAFDPEKAVDAFFHLATVAAKKYCAEFSSADFSFPVQVRFTVAVELRDYYIEDITDTK